MASSVFGVDFRIGLERDLLTLRTARLSKQKGLCHNTERFE
jgi:hypothetical protein